MGRQSDEALELSTVDDLVAYLMGAHSAYMQYETLTYYLTDANDIYWRAQDTNQLNEKGHFVDCSDLVASVRDFVDLPFIEGEQSIRDVFPDSTFYASVKIEGQGTPVPVV
ncbi:MAG: CDP-alcohol phosphatidyltransferase [Eggerthellaceae bacterium]